MPVETAAFERALPRLFDAIRPMPTPGTIVIMRIATFILVALQAQIVFILVIGAATTRSDAAGQGMANAYAMVAAAVFIVLALPALAVAYFTGQQWLALTLAILGMLTFAAFMAMLL